MEPAPFSQILVTRSEAGTYIIRGVAIPDRIESEIPLESDKPPSKSIEHLGEWRVHIKVVFSP